MFPIVAFLVGAGVSAAPRKAAQLCQAVIRLRNWQVAISMTYLRMPMAFSPLLQPFPGLVLQLAILRVQLLGIVAHRDQFVGHGARLCQMPPRHVAARRIVRDLRGVESITGTAY